MSAFCTEPSRQLQPKDLASTDPESDGFATSVQETKPTLQKPSKPTFDAKRQNDMVKATQSRPIAYEGRRRNLPTRARNMVR